MAAARAPAPSSLVSLASGAPVTEWRAQQKQEDFLRLSCFEALYGGAKGGGKTDALIMGAVMGGTRDGAAFVNQPHHRGLLLRREYPEMRRTILARTWELYPQMGGRFREQTMTWYFPSGARIELGHASHPKDVRKYDGAGYNFIGVDEATYWTGEMYLFLIACCRSAHGLPLRFRATTNPGGIGHDFMLERFAPWLYPEDVDEYTGPRAKPREVLHFLPHEGKATGEDIVPKGTPGALARSFVGARVADNKYLAGTEYEVNLGGLDAFTRAQKRDGDWLATAGARVFFKREHFKIVDSFDVPANAVLVRWWDRAATADPKADWTVGLLLAYVRPGTWWIVDIVRGQWEPADVQKKIAEVTRADNARGVRIALAKDPASAGKFEAMQYLADLSYADVHMVPEQRGSKYENVSAKVVRARPLTGQVEAGNIRVVRAKWNRAFFDEAEAFPEGANDDQIDALAGAYRQTKSVYEGGVRHGGARDQSGNPFRSGGY